MWSEQFQLLEFAPVVRPPATAMPSRRHRSRSALGARQCSSVGDRAAHGSETTPEQIFQQAAALAVSAVVANVEAKLAQNLRAIVAPAAPAPSTMPHGSETTPEQNCQQAVVSVVSAAVGNFGEALSRDLRAVVASAGVAFPTMHPPNVEEKAAKLQADHSGLSGEDDGDDGSNSYSSSSSGEIDWSPILDFVAETILKHEDAAASFR